MGEEILMLPLKNNEIAKFIENTPAAKWGSEAFKL